MRNLLDNSSQRIINMIDYLIQHQDWITISKLAKVLHSSPRTIQRDLTYIRENYSQHLDLNITQKNGVKLGYRNIANIGLIYIDLFNDAIALQFLKNIFLHPHASIQFHERTLFTSRSTLLRLLPQVNEVLNPLEMTIVFSQHTFELVSSNEYYLRDFFASFLLELYGIDLKIYDNIISLENLYKLAMQVILEVHDIEEAHFKLEDDIAMSYTMMLCLISLIRESQGYCLYPASVYPISDEMNDLVKTIQDSLPNISCENLYPIFEYVKLQNNNWVSEDEQQLVMYEIELCVDSMANALHLNLPDSFKYQIESSLKSLYSQNKLRTHKTSQLFDRIVYFSEAVKVDNPFFYQVVRDHLSDLSLAIRSDMVSQINNIIFWMIQIFPPFALIHPPKSILIIDDFGKKHATYIRENLRHTLTIDGICTVTIDIANYPHFEQNLKDSSYDLVVSTIFYPSLSHYPLVTISDFIGTNDIINILNRLYDR